MTETAAGYPVKNRSRLYNCACYWNVCHEALDERESGELFDLHRRLLLWAQADKMQYSLATSLWGRTNDRFGFFTMGLVCYTNRNTAIQHKQCAPVDVQLHTYVKNQTLSRDYYEKPETLA